jgi:DNA-binding response OmpR family regulator
MDILYAEDDIMMQKVVVRALVRLGYEVTTVDDGKEAIEVLEQDSFDLIILDLFMPHLSGFEVVDILRHEMNCKTPILILSRNHQDEAIQKAFSYGADEFLVKPFAPEELIIKITKMLASKR